MIIKNIVKIWHIILLAILLTYCIRNWDEVIAFNPFNGNSLLFVVMLGLCILPFISELDINGIKFKSATDRYTDMKEKEAVMEITQKQLPDPVFSEESKHPEITELKERFRELNDSKGATENE